MKQEYSRHEIEAGIDESGRGPLFGRVYTACVILPKSSSISLNPSYIKDSKKFMSKKKLKEAYDYVIENALDYSITYCNEKTIDKMNILQATIHGMHKAINGLKIKPDKLLVDGNYFKPYLDESGYIPHINIKGGDNTYMSIAAASILAKVSRDEYIDALCHDHPELNERYSILTNKGYGTKKHMDGIKQYGITPWHRLSFKPCQI